MSIVAIRNAMEKKGCQFLLILIGLALAAGMVLTVPLFGQPGGDPSQSVTLFSIGDRQVTALQLEDRIKELARQVPNRGTPSAEFGLYAEGIESFVRESVLEGLAAKSGVTLTDATVASAASEMARSQVDETRAQILMSGLAKPGASQADVDKIIQEQLGQSPTDLEGSVREQIMAAWNDEARRGQVRQSLLASAILASYRTKHAVTEDAYKASMDEYTFEEIRFDDLNADFSARESEARKAFDALQQGQAFAEVRRQFSPGNTTEPIRLTRAALESDPATRPLAELEPGQFSDVLQIMGSPVIRKLVSVKPNVPQDFEENKAVLLQNATAQRAQQAFREDFDAAMKAVNVDWKDAGFEAVFTSYRVLTDRETMMNPSARTAALRQELDRIDGIDVSNVQNLVPITLSRFALMEALYQASTAEERRAMLDERLEILAEVLDQFEDNALRLEVAQTLLAEGRPEEAHEYLLKVAELNMDFEASGQQVYATTSRLNNQALNEKKFTADQHALIQAQLERWIDEKAQYEKEKAEAEAEQKRIQEEMDAEAERLRKEEAALDATENAAGPGLDSGGAQSSAGGANPGSERSPGIGQALNGGAGE